MKYYLDITLLPCEEIPIYFLWQKLYQQLHLAFVQEDVGFLEQRKDVKKAVKMVRIGASFPQYDEECHHLGSKLRLFSQSKMDLERLNIKQWLNRLSDYIHITRIRDVPEHVESYVRFKRLQPQTNFASKARRRATKLKISEEEAFIFFKDKAITSNNAPFIQMKSLESNNSFRLIIVREKTDTNDSKADFSTYGLSKTATVPWFH